jgi:hypothetical protein
LDALSLSTHESTDVSDKALLSACAPTFDTEFYLIRRRLGIQPVKNAVLETIFLKI